MAHMTQRAKILLHIETISYLKLLTLEKRIGVINFASIKLYTEISTFKNKPKTSPTIANNSTAEEMFVAFRYVMSLVLPTKLS